MTLQCSDMTSSESFWRYFVSFGKFSYWSKNHVNIITCSWAMTIFFIRDWPEIRKLEIPPSEFCPIPRDWGELGILNLTGMSLMKCYWVLLNVRVTAFIVSELWSEYQQGVKLPPSQIRVKGLSSHSHLL